MEIKVLGAGCPKCKALNERTREAAKSLGLPDEVQYITDISKIATHGVMQTPCLVVNGKVKSAGKVLDTAVIASMIKEEM